MNTTDTLSTIRSAVVELQKAGHESVSVAAFLEYLAKIDGQHPEPAEARKLLHDANLAQYRAVHETNLEMFKSVIEAGRTALNYCILVNSGASVALLTYIGNFLSKNPDATAPRLLVEGLTAFAVAVLLGAVASGVRYISQACFSSRWLRTGHGFNVFSVLLVITAYVLFGTGVWSVYQQFI